MASAKLVGIVAVLIVAVIVFGYTVSFNMGNETVVTTTTATEEFAAPEDCKLHYNQLAKIKERGVLIVGTSADWPPYEYVTPDGEFAGIDIELAKRIAEALGVELQIKDMKFAALFEAVKRGDVDIVIADVAMKPGRLEAIDFSIPYRCESGKAIVIRKADAGSYTGYDWLQGKKIGVQLATTEQDLAEQYFGDKAQVITFDRVYPEMTLALKNGQIDAMIVAPDVAKIIVSKEKDLVIIDSLPFFSCSAVVVPKCAFELKKEVSQVIWDLKQSGEFDKIVEQEIAKWLGAQSAQG